MVIIRSDNNFIAIIYIEANTDSRKKYIKFRKVYRFYVLALYFSRKKNLCEQFFVKLKVT